MMETPNVAGLDLSALAPADKGQQQQQAAAAEAAGGSVGRIPLEETSDGPAPDVADKEPHLAPPGTYFQRNRPNGGRLLAEGASLDFNGLCASAFYGVVWRPLDPSIRPFNPPPPPTPHTHIYTAVAAAPARGKITLEAAPAPPTEASKDPHAAPPGTYFQRNRPNGGRALADGGACFVSLPCLSVCLSVCLGVYFGLSPHNSHPTTTHTPITPQPPPPPRARSPLTPCRPPPTRTRTPTPPRRGPTSSATAPTTATGGACSRRGPRRRRLQVRYAWVWVELDGFGHHKTDTHTHGTRTYPLYIELPIQPPVPKIAAGKITLDSVPAPTEASKDPHAAPPGTYFQRNRPGNGNGR